MKKQCLFFFFYISLIILACGISKKPVQKLPTLDNDMVILKVPITFTMGSPETEKYRTADEIQHQVTIPRSFAH